MKININITDSAPEFKQKKLWEVEGMIDKEGFIYIIFDGGLMRFYNGFSLPSFSNFDDINAETIEEFEQDFSCEIVRLLKNVRITISEREDNE